MELLHLETFANLVQYRNFSLVAKKMNISQPTVTVRIKMLEEELGVDLVIRVGRKVEITPAGQAFYDAVDRSLRVLRDGLETMSNPRENSKPHLSLGGTHTVSYYFLSEMIPDFCHQLDLDLSLYTGQTAEVFEMILDQVVDMGFVCTNLEHPDLIKTKLYQDLFYPVALPSHPLAKEIKIRILDLKDEPLITYQKGRSLNYRIESLFREEGLRSNTIMELKYVNSIKKMVLEGNGISFLPWISIEKDVRNGQMAVLPLALAKPLARDVHFVFHRKHIQSEKIVALVQFVRDYLNLKGFPVHSQ
ncbi:LysR family transcriptional regulator [Ammoniphilus sp. YIM 78166]|uniref:LysR family transcriptional regulator n=1 Tax=Ammoniphilus sp. YIM 78166 TaxID=1644106 RepID=UPI00143208DD|nr:LysR family transcriptional regulator [Ammoniphilus sp. YIM 78166]